jgi:hypothetical protein
MSYLLVGVCFVAAAALLYFEGGNLWTWVKSHFTSTTPPTPPKTGA